MERVWKILHPCPVPFNFLNEIGLRIEKKINEPSRDGAASSQTFSLSSLVVSIASLSLFCVMMEFFFIFVENDFF